MKLTKRIRIRSGKKNVTKKNKKTRTIKKRGPRYTRKRVRKAGNTDMDIKPDTITNTISESDFSDFIANNGGGRLSKKGGEFGEGDNPNDREKRM